MRLRSLAVRGLALLIAAAIFLLTGEAALRVLYRDGGARTLGGPGSRPFDHLTTGRDQLRGRRDVGPRRDGLPRLMILGDSITYGQGVHDWRDTWPEVLVTSLEREGHPYEAAVFADPGRDIPKHLQEVQRWGPVVKPDVLIYQWYVNDIEIVQRRPDRVRAWQRWPTHPWLRRNSYLYYFLDNRASELLPQPDRTYVDYILQDFKPGTVEWSEFERYFHAFSIAAASVAKRRILMLYPQVPYRDAYPLQPLNDLMKTLAGPHTLTIPPMAWLRAAGQLESDAGAPWELVMRSAAGASGPIVETQEYVVAAGSLPLQVVVSAPDLADASAPIATLQLVDAASGSVVATHEVIAQGGLRGFQTITVPFTVGDGDARRVRFRVLTTGRAAWSLASMGIGVSYGYDVLDLTVTLNRFNTHASLFDAHPNEAAHRVIAEEVRRLLLSSRE
jgi:hypothetical protein